MPAHAPIPCLPGRARKNDALFMYGAVQPLPFVFAYAQESIEIIYGPSCKVEAEIFMDRCTADATPVFERRGGGGTVVLAPGVTVIAAVGAPGPSEGIRNIFSRIHRGLIAVLAPLISQPIEEAGVSDLAICGRKILGSSLYLTAHPKRFYYQASLLVDADLGILERYLAHPPKEPDYRQGRPHAAFCTTLRAHGCRLSAHEAAELITTELGRRIR